MDTDEEILKAQTKKDCKFQDICKREGRRMEGVCLTGGVTVYKGKTYPCFIFNNLDKKEKRRK